MKDKVEMFRFYDEEYGIGFGKKEQKRQLTTLDKNTVGVLLNRKLMID